MIVFSLPNFRGYRAHVIHVSDQDRALLVEHLERLGLLVQTCWPIEGLKPDVADLVLFDADMGFDGLFSWEPGQSPVPMIALLGSEAPGRIEWALSQSPSAFLLKPIRSTGVFSALAIACHTFARRRQQELAIQTLKQRVKARPLVFKAILMLMHELQLGDDDAFRMLRAESMKRRVSIEDLCQRIVTRTGTNILERCAGP